MQCEFIKPDELQCGANSMDGFVYCFTHNPATQEEKEKAVLKGGLAPKPRKDPVQLEPIKIQSISDVVELLEDTINRIRTEPITHQKANCIGFLANIIIRAREVGGLEDTIETLEKRLFGQTK